MGRIRRTVAVGGVVTVAVACLLVGAGDARAQVPLPPAPSLPVPQLPAETAPIIAITAPTLGPACGTASLVSLLTPSLAEGFLKIPLSSLVDSPTLRSYANAALYICGFIPFALTPTQCEVDHQIVDAIRGLSPLAAQVVGLFPEGATVDTVLAIEALLPPGPSVAGPLSDQLFSLLGCTRSSGAPPTPPTTDPGPLGPLDPAPVPSSGSILGPTSPSVDRGAHVAAPPAVAVAGPVAVPTEHPDVFETQFVPRSGVQWAGLAAGVLLLAGSLAGWAVRPGSPGRGGRRHR